MKCLHPVSLKTGIVRCGKCSFCLSSKRSEWTFRLRKEYDVASSAYFLTLTYCDEKLPLYNEDTGEELVAGTLSRLDVQRFLKRLRKYQKKFSDATIRYYLVGEYGTKGQRPHYHAIIFNVCQQALLNIGALWSAGGVDCGTCTPASMHYVTKFHLNKHKGWNEGEGMGRLKPFVLYPKGRVESA